MTNEAMTNEAKTNEAKKPARSAAARGKAAPGLTDAGELDALAKIAAMPEADRALAERIHALVQANAPGLTPRTWYGMPAYARDGEVICFFQSAHRFKTRYSTFGFSDKANLDQGTLWPVAFALKELTADDEAAIAALLRKSVS